MAGTPRAKQAQILNPHELARLLARLVRVLPSSAWVDAQFVYIAGVDAHGRPLNTAVYVPDAHPCPPKADSARSRMRRCVICGRWVPAGYIVVGPTPRGQVNGVIRQCQDCAIMPDDPTNDAFGPSPHHAFLETARRLRVRSDGWSKRR